jgi:hypothetical protein
MTDQRLKDLTDQLRAERQTDFAKYLWASLAAKSGSHADVIYLAGREFGENFSAKLARINKATISGGMTTDATWAGELAEWRSLTSTWVAKQVARSLFGALNPVKVGFNTRTLYESVPSNAGYVVDGAPSPLTRMDLARTETLSVARVESLVAFTEEQVQTWSPATGSQLEESTIRSVNLTIDRAALDPDSPAVGNLPSSLTYGVTPTPFSGSGAQAVHDGVVALIRAHIDTGADPNKLVLVGHPGEFLSMAALRLSGQRVFPDLEITGGSVFGVRAYATEACVRTGSPSEKFLAVLAGDKVLVADDGHVGLDFSNQASLQMTNVPASAAAALISLWQTNSVAARLQRYINFKGTPGAASWGVPFF